MRRRNGVPKVSFPLLASLSRKRRKREFSSRVMEQHEQIQSIHDTVVQSLMDKMDADSGLLAPILDALSNLNLEQEQMTTVHERVLPKLASAELEVLPLLVKFLLATAEDTPEGAEVIEAIRKLDVTALGSEHRRLV